MRTARIRLSRLDSALILIIILILILIVMPLPPISAAPRSQNRVSYSMFPPRHHQPRMRKVAAATAAASSTMATEPSPQLPPSKSGVSSLQRHQHHKSTTRATSLKVGEVDSSTGSPGAPATAATASTAAPAATGAATGTPAAAPRAQLSDQAIINSHPQQKQQPKTRFVSCGRAGVGASTMSCSPDIGHDGREHHREGRGKKRGRARYIVRNNKRVSSTATCGDDLWRGKGSKFTVARSCFARRHHGRPSMREEERDNRAEGERDTQLQHATGRERRHAPG